MRTLRFDLLSVAGVVFTLGISACGAAPAHPAGPEVNVAEREPGGDLAAARDDAESSPANPSGTKDPRLEVTDLGTIRIGVVGHDANGDPLLVATSAMALLEKAADLTRRDKTTEAIAVYREVVRDFPDSGEAPVALASIALIYEARPDMDAAVATWLERATSYPVGRDALESHIRAAALEAQRERWASAEAIIDDVAKRTDLTYADQLELWSRKGYVQVEQGKLDQADASLTQALAVWKQAPRLADTYYVAMAYFYAGDVAHQRFVAAPLRLNQLRADLDAKQALGVIAYDTWKSALKFRQPYWGTASGYRMSNVFYEFWTAAVTAPYPPELTVDARPAYIAEVHERLHEQLLKSLEGHKMNLELAKAYGVGSYWSKLSGDRAVELLSVIDRERRGLLITPDSPAAPTKP